MYSTIDMMMAVGLTIMAVTFFETVLFAAIFTSKMEQTKTEYQRVMRDCEKVIERQAKVISEKDKFIVRFKYKCIGIVQQYLQDDVAACTMIIASINGIKEKNEISDKDRTMQKK